MNPAESISSDDDEIPHLSTHSFNALAEFYAKNEDEKEVFLSENWQLSQFWYDEATTNKLAEECHLTGSMRIACLSCPTLFCRLLHNDTVKLRKTRVILFEYDARFSHQFGDDIVVSYDYRKPLNVPDKMKHDFDLVVVDPPFLSVECAVKMAQTVRLLSISNAKLIVCTGAVMQDHFKQFLNVDPCGFVPKHRNYLANDFACYANFPTSVL